jgi:adenosylhomocysteine nucleosidase
LNETGVVAALAAEARTLGLATQRRDGLGAVGQGTIVAVSGIGGSAATLAARSLVEAGVGSLVSWGMAGGLNPALRAGTICLPHAVISSAGAKFLTDPHWREQLGAAIAGRSVVGGALISSVAAIDSAAGKAAAFRDTGAMAVDMESAAVAEIAALHGLPFLAVRAIVDTADDTLPRQVVAASIAGQVQVGRLILGVARSPLAIAALLRLAGRYRAATRALAAVARTGALARGAFAAAAGFRVA